MVGNVFSKIKDKILVSKKTGEIPIGLDIGTNFLKLVELEDYPQGKQLKNCEIIKIPSSSQEPHRLKAVNQALQTLKKKITVKKKQEVILAISDPMIIYKELRLPFMPKDELAKVVYLQMERSDASLLKNAIMDFCVITASADEKGVKNLDLIVVIAPYEIIEEYVSCVQGRGFKPVGIGLKLFAITDYFRLNHKELLTDITALINIGSQKTITIIMKEGEICFVRHSALGGSNFTRAISEDLEVDYNKAEELKIQYGITEEPVEEQERRVSFAIRPILEQFLVEIECSFGYFAQKFSKARVNKIFLCGGGAALKNVANFLTKETKMSVEVFDPLKGIKQSLMAGELISVNSPQLLTAAGLTQGEVLSQINLLPSKIKELKRKITAIVREKGVVNLSIMFLVSVLLITCFGLIITVNRCQKKIKIIEDKIKEEKSQLSDAQIWLEKNKVLEEKVFLVGTVQGELFWSDILQDIGKTIIIDNVWLRKLTFTAPVFSGKTEDKMLKLWGSTFSQELLNDYVARLSKLDYFNTVVIDSTMENTRENYKIIDFEISCKLR